jgi:hypothetical protein
VQTFLNANSSGTRASITRIKKRPRGKSFQPGNGFGSEHRFKKGMPSANPSGRPLCKEISVALRERLASDGPIPAKTGAEKPANAWYQQAKDGNVPALVSLANRVEGCPAVSISHDGTGDNLALIVAHMEDRSRQYGPPEGMIPRPVLEEGDADEHEQGTEN